jgi:Arc/MetJ-type ribon-helix-helix transcriptional regulator
MKTLDSQLKESRLKKEIQKGYDSAANGNSTEWSVDKFKNKVRKKRFNAHP